MDTQTRLLVSLALLIGLALGLTVYVRNAQGGRGEELVRAQPEAAHSQPQANGDLGLLYVFSGVSDDGQQGSAARREATSIHCTNLDPLNNVQVEVQVFQWNGTDVYTGTVNMPPGRTFTFSTQNTTIYFDDVILGGSPGTPAIFQGHGRVFAESGRVICTAQVLDPLNYPPLFMDKLSLHYSDGTPVGEPFEIYLPLSGRG